MRYHERLETWLPLWARPLTGELPHEAAVRCVQELIGIRPVPLANANTSDAPAVYVLEADEDETSPAWLEVHVNAQWLTRHEITRCTCIDPLAHGLAGTVLA